MKSSRENPESEENERLTKENERAVFAAQQQATQDTECLNPECDGLASTRGLCLGCYQVARRLVKENKTTWATLVAAGRCRASTKPGGNTSAWLLKEP